MRPFYRPFSLLLLPFLASCVSMDIDDFKDVGPTLVIEEYFTGKTWAWGIFEDRFGNLKREFRVEIDGESTGCFAYKF